MFTEIPEYSRFSNFVVSLSGYISAIYDIWRWHEMYMLKAL